MFLADYSKYFYFSFLSFDKTLSSLIIRTAHPARLTYEDQFARKILLLLEISGHGLIWISGALLWNVYRWGNAEMRPNFFLIGLILDVIIVGLTKAIVRRPRPRDNIEDMIATASIDRYSFPSGHASRSFFIAAYAFFVMPSYAQILITWAFVLSLSRILMKRHYLADVIIGANLGIVIGFVLGRFSNTHYD
ncbi:hypothetical protein LOD99_4117 [Oopsacas minuta]|uniref:Phosphatidic acid phosphatase type 2/haloperoxidase domain-containing protein n=1 Tax=Oopsacas minuta TaxID=111878 RepID=A0AAV7JV14_9METZ|nr:hypothetical protein LOD99_4117 [Oopsacas minuta]